MSTVSDKPVKALLERRRLTAAMLLRSLGGVDPSRVRLRPAPGTATEADVLAAEAEPRKALCELIEGTLVEKPMGFIESSIAMTIGYLLTTCLKSKGIRGIVAGADGFMRLAPGSVRYPDVSFVALDQPGRILRMEPIVDFAPDLAVEVLSKSNTRREMAMKRQQYFAAGTMLVWEVFPKQRCVDVYTNADAFVRLGDTETITGGEVLPGFRATVAEFFPEFE